MLLLEDEGAEPADRVGVSFFSRAVFAFFLALLVLSIAATASAIQTDYSAVYLSTLSVAITFVAAVHYRSIVRLREGAQPEWLARSTRANLELQIDALRMTDWLITMPLLVLKFYAILGRAEFGKGYDSFYTAQEQPALIAVVMIALGACVRLATDDFAKDGLNAFWTGGALVCYVLALLCLLLLTGELLSATADVANRDVLRSFFVVWVGYPLVSLVCIVWRRGEPDAYREWFVSVVRDVGYGALDCYSKGFFVLLTVGAHFGVPILGWTHSLPLVWK